MVFTINWVGPVSGGVVVMTLFLQELHRKTEKETIEMKIFFNVCVMVIA